MKFAFAFFSGFFILVSASFAFPFNLKLSEQELDLALNVKFLFGISARTKIFALM